MASAHIFYNSSSYMSQIVMQVCRIHPEQQGYTTTLTDVTGKNNAQLLSAVQAVTDMTAVYVATTTQATYSSAGVLTYDHIAEIDNCLVTASKGTSIATGTCQSNATPTNIILATTASDADDTYNGKYIRTAGSTVKSRYISDYTGSSRTAVVVTTSTAITTTETYTVFSKSTKCYVVGDASSNVTAARVAWDTLYPTKSHPMIIRLIGGAGTIATDYNGNTDGVTTFKQAVEVTRTSGGGAHSSTTLSDTGHFTIDAYINKWVGIESSTLGTGQIRQITDNTADALTVAPWDTTPTGTVVYTISDNEEFCLAHKYIPLFVPTYLYGTDEKTLGIWKKLIDKYGTLSKSGTDLVGDLELLKTYLQRGKCIFDAQAKGVVT